MWLDTYARRKPGSVFGRLKIFQRVRPSTKIPEGGISFRAPVLTGHRSQRVLLHSRVVHMPKLFWIGLAVLVIGQVPLLLIIVAASLSLWPDRNPNPIGPGLLSFLTFWPGVVLMLLGYFRSRSRLT